LRNPRRTGSTATALIIGVAVVALFTVMAASFLASLDKIIDEQVAGDVIVQTSDIDSFTGLAPDLQDRLRGLPEVDTAVGLGTMPARVVQRRARPRPGHRPRHRAGRPEGPRAW
jgi:putative ABC transport system permease protein